MTTLFIFLMMLITIWLYLAKRRKAFIVTSAISVLGFIMFGDGIFSSFTLNYLELGGKSQSNPAWKNNNAIILLGAGSVSTPVSGEIKPTVLAYSRINETAKLYSSCIKSVHQCSIIISGGDASKTGTPEAVVYKNELIALGVKNSDITLEKESKNTYENAKFTTKILQQKSFDNILLVTSGMHMRRSLLYFSNFGTHCIPAAADYMSPIISKIPLGYNFAVSDFILHEYFGILRLHVYNFLGWNKIS
jgi:uncharacterized SAM-binding protein YcdF (DUF218 family)